MIITQEKKGTIVQGELIVKNKEKLTELRDELLEVNRKTYNINIMRNLAKLNSSVLPGYFKDGDKLVYQQIKDIDLNDGITLYDRKEYQSKYLNSIQLFTSLLGGLNFSKYDLITQKMITEGLVEWAPFNKELWNNCISNIIKNVYSQIDAGEIQNISDIRKNLDLMVLRWAILEEKLIEFNIVEKGHFAMNDIKLTNQASNSQTILFGNNHLFENHLAKKRTK